MDSGVSVLLIDHDTQLVMDVCDTVNVLDFGSMIASGPPQQVKADPVVVHAYLGVGAHRPGAPGKMSREQGSSDSEASHG